MSLSKTWLLMIIIIAATSAYENLYSEGEILLENDYETEKLSQREHGLYSKRDELNQPVSQNKEVVSLEKRQFYPFCPYYGSGSTQLCCGDKVYTGSFPYNAVCCGNSYMDSNTALCCNNVIQIVNDSINQLSCCGADIYNISSQICCNNATYTSTGNLTCCDSNVYDSSSQICCNGNVSDTNGQILSCCQNISYQLNDYNCISNGVIQAKPNNSSLFQVCGNQVINYQQQMCCQGNPQPRDNDLSLCCGNATFDSSSQMCCNGTVYNNPTNTSSCCVTKMYDSNAQVCCNGNLLPRPVNSVGVISYCYQPFFGSNSQSPENINYSPYFICCGTQLLTNYTTQLCCNDILYNLNPNNIYSSSCCGSNIYSYASNQSCCTSDIYDPTAQTCCADQIVTGPNLSCCGESGYDLNTEVCCNTTIYAHDSVPANTCCNQNNNFEIIY